MHRFHNNRRVDQGYEAHNNALRQFGKFVARQTHFVRIRMKKIREPQLVTIRNKYTKEVVDLEVRDIIVINVGNNRRRISCTIKEMFYVFKQKLNYQKINQLVIPTCTCCVA